MNQVAPAANRIRATIRPSFFEENHFGAVQFTKPKVAMVFDLDQDKAVAARQEYFKRAAASGTLMGATHLPFPGLVQLKVKGDGFVATPVK